MEIPQNLRQDFKILEAHENLVHTTSRQTVKQSIRFDDSEWSLQLNILLSQFDPWVTVLIEQAKEAKRLRGSEPILPST